MSRARPRHATAASRPGRPALVRRSASRWPRIPRSTSSVELIGGATGRRWTWPRRRSRAGKPVVTANKALLAMHGAELAALAEDDGVALAFEAAVAGGIPIIKALREGLAANRIARVYGILNGTCNYILTEMRETGRDFADVLGRGAAPGLRRGRSELRRRRHRRGAQARHPGGARVRRPAALRRDPHRGHPPRRAARHRVRRRARLPHQAARHRPADRARRSSSACIPAWCRSTRRSRRSRACSTRVVVEGDFVGASMLEGRGAGAGPDRVGGGRRPHRHRPRRCACRRSACPAARLDDLPRRRWSAMSARYYLRLMVVDRPGVIADVAAVPARPRGLDREP